MNDLMLAMEMTAGVSVCKWEVCEDKANAKEQRGVSRSLNWLGCRSAASVRLPTRGSLSGA